MLRVGYYLAALPPGTAGGVVPYSTRIIENLLDQPGEVAYHLLVTPAQVGYARELQARFPQRSLSWSRIRPLPALSRLLRPLELASLVGPGRMLRGALAGLNYLEWQTLRQRVDFIHCPTHLAGAIYWRVPTIVTMHDVQELRFPEFFTPAERFLRAGMHWAALEAATKIVVSYAHVKADLLRYFRLPPAKIQVCPIPITPAWLPASGGGDVCARYQIEPGFLFYPAQTWPHKNHIGLLHALAQLRDTFGLTPTLICTGRQTAHFAAIEAEITALGLERQVRFLGLIPSADLVGLYRTCRAVVIPSLYEAGSFPLYEAMLLGAAVICSRVTSLPETIAAPEFTFDACDPLDMARLMRQILSDAGFYRLNLEHSLRRRAAFAETPGQSAAAFEQLYRTMVAQASSLRAG